MTAMRLAGALVLVVSAACGSSGDDDDAGQATAALDCDWIESDNCWKQALAQVALCVPQSVGTTGTLDASGLTCSYEGGPTVRFDEPLLPFMPDPIGVTVESGGVECVRFERDYGSIRLETARGLLTAEGTMGSANTIGMTIQCPDGSAYVTDDYLATMRSCQPDPSDWPGTVVEQMGPGRVGIDLPGGPGQIELFSCSYQ